MSKDLKCKYIFKDEYNPKYVNGAQGGVNTQGEIVVNFYFERNAIPNSQTFNIKDSGELEKEPKEIEPKDLKNSLVRVIENGIVMNYRTAKEVHRWLGEHIKNLENLAKISKDGK